MNISQIRINQTLPQVGIHSTVPGRMNIQLPEQMIEIDYEPADMEIVTYDVEIRTDWTKTYIDMGLKTNAARRQEYVADMRGRGLEAIAQKARDGDRMGNIAAGEQRVFSNLARERFFRDNEVHTNVGLVPRHMPEFEVDVRPPDISVRWNSPEIRETGQHLDIRYEPGAVHIYMAVEPVIDIEV